MCVGPAADVNYDFILGMYVFFLALGALFSALEFAARVDAVKGFYLVFAPFLPATAWCLVVRRRWLVAKKAQEKPKAE